MVQTTCTVGYDHCQTQLRPSASALFMTVFIIFLFSDKASGCVLQSHFTAKSFLRRSEQAQICLELIRQCGLTQDGGVQAFVASDTFNRPQHILKRH